jgi:hypothetical protein
VTMPRALDVGRIRKRQIGAAFHQNLNESADVFLLGFTEFAPLVLELVGVFDVPFVSIFH